MTINEDYLNKLEFRPFLDWLMNNLRYLYHRPKTDFAIHEANDLSRIIEYQLVRHYHLGWNELHNHHDTYDFHDANELLKEYKFKTSDKKKKELIERYVKIVYDAASMLVAKKDVTPPESN
jgi:hypothetical protein